MSLKTINLSLKAGYLMFSPKICKVRLSPRFTTAQRTFHFGRNQKLANFALLRSSHLILRDFCQKRSNIPEMTITDVKNRVSEIMGVQKGFTASPPDRKHLLQYLPKTQEELPTRTMQDSFDSALIPISTDLLLQDKYMTLMGNVRKGRLLEDMDIYAVWICLKYIKNPKINPKEPFPYTLVTAAVDQITFKGWQCKVTDDMRISGQVQWVGKSSIEVCVWLESLVTGEWKLFTKAYFIMVARNSTNTKGSFVNKLKPEGALEEEKYARAQERMQRRSREQKTSLFKIPPTEDEQRKVHETYIKTVDMNDLTLIRRILHSNAVWMESTKISNMMFPHPEDRNSHNTMFGGLLMRFSLELSWIVANTFGKQRPALKHISDVTFKSPVSINSFVRLTSQVVFTELNHAQVMVHCELVDIVTSKLFTTNVFHYTYEFNDVVPEVVPKSYREAMLWIDGRRHFLEVMERTF